MTYIHIRDPLYLFVYLSRGMEWNSCFEDSFYTNSCELSYFEIKFYNIGLNQENARECLIFLDYWIAINQEAIIHSIIVNYSVKKANSVSLNLCASSFVSIDLRWIVDWGLPFSPPVSSPLIIIMSCRRIVEGKFHLTQLRQVFYSSLKRRNSLKFLSHQISKADKIESKGRIWFSVKATMASGQFMSLPYVIFLSFVDFHL